ncbi:MAG: IclR family transcriptional regulator [Haloferacaceae archaeon]
MGTTHDGTIEAVNRSMKVIETIKELEGAGVTDLANELGWAKSTVHTHLKTLVENEFLIRDDGQYDLSHRFMDCGEYVKDRHPIYSAVEPKLEELADETGKRVQFITQEHGYAIYVRIAEGEHSVSTGAKLGRRRMMLHATAAGKSILSHLPRDEADAILDDQGLYQFTENTITDRQELYEEFAEIRERGYAVNREEHIEGLRAIAAPVTTPDGDVLGAVSVADAAHRMKGEWFEEELPELLLGVVNEIELDVAYS